MRSYYSYGQDAYDKKISRILIIVSIIFFVFLKVFAYFNIRLEVFFALSTYLFLKKFMIWQLITYPFVNISLFSLLINMLMFYFFAMPMESIWGTKRFLSFFLYIVITTGFVFLVGASFFGGGIIFGMGSVIFAFFTVYGFLYPESIVYILGLFPMKMKHAVFLYAGIEILSILSEPYASYISLFQLSGGVMGYLYLRSKKVEMFVNNLSSLFSMKRLKNLIDEMKRKNIEELDREVDRILDKISKKGIHSLTKRERKILERKRRMSKNDN